MATHSSILARKIPWTENPGGLQSMVQKWATVNGTKVEKRAYNKRKNVGENTMNVETPQPLDEDAPVTPTETSNTDDTDNIQTENENPNY